MQRAAQLSGNNDYAIWDELVKESPQGNVFHTSAWNSTIRDVNRGYEPLYYVSENKGTIEGGLVFSFSKKFNKTLLPSFGYNGPFFNPQINYEQPFKTQPGYDVGKAIVDSVAKRFNHIEIKNSPEIWNTKFYSFNGWVLKTRYTHLFRFNSQSEVKEKIDSSLNKISNDYSFQEDFSDKKIKVFCSTMSRGKKDESKNLEIYLDALRNAGLGKLMTLSERVGQELALMLIIPSEINRTLYASSLVPLSTENEIELLASSIRQCRSLYHSDYDQVDIGESHALENSIRRDRIGCELVPFYLASNKR